MSGTGTKKLDRSLPIVRDYVLDKYFYFDDLTMDELIERAQEVKRKYGEQYTNLHVSVSYNNGGYYNECCCHAMLIGTRAETEEEARKRWEKECKEAKFNEELQRKQYEELKKKFE